MIIDTKLTNNLHLHVDRQKIKYTHKKSHSQITANGLSGVIEQGFEPWTHSLEGCCSIQLSYSTDLKSDAKVRVIYRFYNSNG